MPTIVVFITLIYCLQFNGNYCRTEAKDDKSMVIPGVENSLYDSLAVEYNDDYEQIGLLKVIADQNANDDSQVLQDELNANTYPKKLRVWLKKIANVISWLGVTSKYILFILAFILFLYCFYPICIDVCDRFQPLKTKRVRDKIVHALTEMKPGVYKHPNGDLEEYEPLDEEREIYDKLNNALANLAV